MTEVLLCIVLAGKRQIFRPREHNRMQAPGTKKIRVDLSVSALLMHNIYLEHVKIPHPDSVELSLITNQRLIGVTKL